jgi:cytochrome c553
MAFSRYWQKQTNWLKVSSKQEAEENFNQLSKDDFKQIAKQYSKQPVYAIVNLRAELSGIPVTESTHYKVVKLQ